MKKVLHIRVLLDFEKDVFRDIEIGIDDSFSRFHDIIQVAFGFDNSQMASFYQSNEDWIKGREITLMDVGEKDENGDPILLMNEVTIGDFLQEKAEKMIYVFDFLVMWCFYIDVVNFVELDDKVILPRIVHSFGDAPGQNSKSPELIFENEDEIFDEGDMNYDFDDDEEEDDIFKSMGGSSDHPEDQDF